MEQRTIKRKPNYKPLYAESYAVFYYEDRRGSGLYPTANLNTVYQNAWAQIREDTEYYGENYRTTSRRFY